MQDNCKVLFLARACVLETGASLHAPLFLKKTSRIYYAKLRD